MLNEIIRGGEALLHDFRRSRPIIKLVLYIFIIIPVLFAVLNTWKYANDAPLHWDHAIAYGKVKILCSFKSDEDHINWRYSNGERGTISVGMARKILLVYKLFGADQITNAAFTGAKFGVFTSFGLVFLILGSCWLRGRELIQKTHVESKRGPSKYKIVGGPWTEGGENPHTLIIGTTGSGKTVSISEILDQIEAGDKATFYDKLKSFILHYYKKDEESGQLIDAQAPVANPSTPQVDDKPLEDAYNSPSDDVPPLVADQTKLPSADPAQGVSSTEPAAETKTEVLKKPIKTDSAPSASHTLTTNPDWRTAERGAKAAEDKRNFAMTTIEELLESPPALDSERGITKEFLEELKVSGTRLLKQIKENTTDTGETIKKIIDFYQMNTKPSIDDPVGYDDPNTHIDLVKVIAALDFVLNKPKTKSKKRTSAKAAGKDNAKDNSSSKTKAKPAPTSKRAKGVKKKNAVSLPLFDFDDGKARPKRRVKKKGMF